MDAIFTVDGLISFFSLALMEIVLGIDNVIFISILTGRLPEHQQAKARNIGLSLALIIRIGLLFALSLLIGLSDDLFSLLGHGFSGRDLIMIGGGIFLVYKSTIEIHHKLEGQEEATGGKKLSTLQAAILQIILLDLVFSFDSILTAIGLVQNVYIMVAAVIVSMGIMLFAAKSISDFINKHPTLKMLALSFLLMIGVLLVADGFHYHVPKGYIYFSIFFSLFVELLNMRARRKRKGQPVKLRQRITGQK